ncbi:MAG: hypothetical protein JXA23_07830 [Bacteroidales bacterium]|nr:hypothetical protein [Bacteroidales bacterium]
MLRNSLFLIVLAAFAVIAFTLVNAWHPAESLSPVAEHYATNGPTEVGAANLVTAVVVTYRGFDTLGEVTILFVTAAIIGFFLSLFHSESPEQTDRLMPASEILSTASKLLIPFMLVLGIYVFVNGHLTPGGGFQGGAIIASAFVLLLLADPLSKLNHRIIAMVESVSGVAFVLIGLLGIFLAGGFLDNRILDLGTFGALLSAGVIPLLYIFIGLKVGSELTNIIGHLQQTQKNR